MWTTITLQRDLAPDESGEQRQLVPAREESEVLKIHSVISYHMLVVSRFNDCRSQLI